MFKLYPEGYLVECSRIHLFSWESSSFGTEFFVILPLTSVGTISQEMLNPTQLSEMYYTFLSHSLNLGYLVLPQIGLLVGLWELISFPFCLLRQS
jgi:hypothetical protein